MLSAAALAVAAIGNQGLRTRPARDPDPGKRHVRSQAHERKRRIRDAERQRSFG